MRVVLEISYDGAGYYGFQKQKKHKTIQGELERAIEIITGENLIIVSSGRTDSGVSAKKQIVAFDTTTKLPLKKFCGYLNRNLPSDIRVNNAYITSENFNPRFNVKTKTYVYSFYLNKNEIPYYNKFATQVYYDVDLNILKKELKSFIGTHDFSSFCSSETQVTNKIRTITKATIIKHGDIYKIAIEGNGFLYNMVRIMVGTLFDISRGKLKSNVKEIIAQKDRRAAGVTAPSMGLLLYDVKYM